MNKPSATFLLCSALAIAQGVDGPTLGIEHDSHARVLRPIRGIVGAALLGDATSLDLDGPTVGAVYAVGVDGSTKQTVVQRLATGEKYVLAGAPAEGASVLLSPGETTLAFVVGSRVSIFRGLPEAELQAEFEIPQGARALALSDDGVLLGNSDGLWRWSADGSARVMEQSASAAAFEPAGARAALAAGSHLLVLNADGELSTLAEAEAVSGISFLSRGRVVAVSAGSRKAYFVNGDSLATLSLEFEPNVLRSLGGDVFQVSDALESPLWLLDVSTEVRTAFVPKSTEEPANE